MNYMAFNFEYSKHIFAHLCSVGINCRVSDFFQQAQLTSLGYSPISGDKLSRILEKDGVILNNGACQPLVPSIKNGRYLCSKSVICIYEAICNIHRQLFIM